MAVFNVHAGHAPYNSGGAYGAVGILNESIEDRKVKDELIRLLRNAGHTVYDCTCEKPYNQQWVLNDIVTKCNQHSAELDISIHLNSGRNDYAGDGSTGGCEVFGYDTKVQNISAKISAQIAKNLGIRDRGFKTNTSLFVLRQTKSPSILIECCFVDDKDDSDKWDAIKCAEAIYTAITGSVPQHIETPKIENMPKQWTSDLHYRVYQQKIGWGKVCQAGEVAGEVGKSLRVEAIRIDYPKHDVYAKVHMQGKGWIDFHKINRDMDIGIAGKGIRLECLCLKGDFEYRVHIQGTGWTAWTKADGINTLGTVGQALRIEAIELREM